MQKLIAILALFPLAGAYGQYCGGSQTVVPCGGPVCGGSVYPCSAAAGEFTYYVDPAGNDSADGRTPATAWATLAHAAAATIQPGESVALKRGSTFRETFVPTQSGSVGSRITWDAYGVGANPVISGSDVLTGWQADQGGSLTWTQIWSAEAQVGNSSWSPGGYGAKNHRNVLLKANITGTATKIRLKWKQHPTNPSALASVTIGQRSGSTYNTFASTPTTCATNLTLTAGAGYVYTPTCDFTIAANTDYMVAYYAADTFWMQQLTHATVTQGYEGNGADVSTDLSLSGYTVKYFQSLAAMEAGVARAPLSSVYQSSLTYTPSGLFRNDTYLPNKKNTIAELVADGDWYYDGSAQLLYLYSATTPASDLIEAVNPSRVVGTMNLVSLAVSNVSIRNLTVKHGYLINITTLGLANSTLYNIESKGAGSSAISVSDGTHDVVFDRINAHHGGYYTGDRNGFSIGNNNAGSYNLTIKDSEIHDMANHNIEFATTFTGQTVHDIRVTNTKIYNSAQQGVQVGGGQQNISFDYCLFYGNQLEGMGVNDGASGNPSVTMYHNTLYNNGLSGLANRNTNMRFGTANVTWKNNIFSNGGGGSGTEVNRFVGTGGTFVADYNEYYHAAGGNFMVWLGTATDFAGFKTAASQDAHSITTNPLFTNAATSDFTLQAGSPAIGTGVSIPGISTSATPNIGAK